MKTTILKYIWKYLGVAGVGIVAGGGITHLYSLYKIKDYKIEILQCKNDYKNLNTAYKDFKAFHKEYSNNATSQILIANATIRGLNSNYTNKINNLNKDLISLREQHAKGNYTFGDYLYFNF